MRYGSFSPLAGALGVLITGCGAGAAAGPEPLNVTSYGATSTPSASGSGSFGRRGPTPSATRPEEGAGILAAPDVLEVPFAIAVEGEGPEAVASLEPEAKALSQRIQQATGRPVATRMRTLRFERVAYGKMESPKRQTVAEGCVEVDIQKDVEFWSRGRVLAAIAAVAPAEHVLTKESHRTTFGAPIPRVRDVESRRKELVERWMSRSRAFIAAADVDGASKLHLSECAPPLAIQQTPVGTDQVHLSLPATCKLSNDAPR